MAEKYIDYVKMLINYKGNSVYIVIDDTNTPWFNAKDVTKLLDYENTKRTIQINVNEKNKKELRFIIENYNLLYKNVQGQSLFINEKGVNELIIKSKKKEAIEIQQWLADEVMPSLLKTGRYELDKNLKRKSNAGPRPMDQICHTKYFLFMV